jgi:hypothetical protein
MIATGLRTENALLQSLKLVMIICQSNVDILRKNMRLNAECRNYKYTRPREPFSGCKGDSKGKLFIFSGGLKWARAFTFKLE